MAEKLFYSMGEVAEMFDVNASLLRHWETQFSVLRPRRNKKGNRLYTPADVDNLKLIYHLVKERGMTLEGARKALRETRGSGRAPRDMELLERLQRIRAMLLEVRQELRAEEGDVLVEEVPAVKDADDPASELMTVDAVPSVKVSASDGTRKPRRKTVVKVNDAKDTPDESGAVAPAAKRPVRKPRRKKEEGENKELFAFFEQSLF